MTDSAAAVTASAGTEVTDTNHARPVAVNEIVSQWINSEHIDFSTGPDDSQIRGLIAQLETAKAAASGEADHGQRFQVLINQLNAALAQHATSTGQTPADAKLTQLAHEIGLVQVIDNALNHGNSVVSDSLSNLTQKNQALETVTNEIFTTTPGWSSYNDSQSVQAPKKLLSDLEGLSNAGFDLNSLGLSNLKNDLQEATDAYDTANQKASTDQDKQMALSVLRTSVATAKVNYAHSVGLDDHSALVESQQSTIATEQIWQTNTNMPWEKTSIPNPADYSPSGLKKYSDELNSRYKMAISAGDTITMRAIQVKLSIIDKSLNNSASGFGDAELNAINTWLSLENADMATKAVLMSKAQSIKDDSQRNQITQQLSQDIDHINSLISATTSQINTIGSYMVRQFDF